MNSEQFQESTEENVRTIRRLKQLGEIIDFLFRQATKEDGLKSCYWYTEKYSLEEIADEFRRLNTRLKKPFRIKIDESSVVFGNESFDITVTTSWEGYQIDQKYSENFEVFLKN